MDDTSKMIDQMNKDINSYCDNQKKDPIRNDEIKQIVYELQSSVQCIKLTISDIYI